MTMKLMTVEALSAADERDSAKVERDLIELKVLGLLRRGPKQFTAIRAACAEYTELAVTAAIKRLAKRGQIRFVRPSWRACES